MRQPAMELRRKMRSFKVWWGQVALQRASSSPFERCDRPSEDAGVPDSLRHDKFDSHCMPGDEGEVAAMKTPSCCVDDKGQRDTFPWNRRRRGWRRDGWTWMTRMYGLPEKSDFKEAIENNRSVVMSIFRCGQRVSNFLAEHTGSAWNPLETRGPPILFCILTGISHFRTKNCCFAGVSKAR